MANADLVRDIYEAFERGDMETVLGSMDARVSWREAESSPYNMQGQTWIGPAAVVENLFARLPADWESLAVSPVSYDESGDRVIVEGRYEGKSSSTGKSLNAQFCHIWNVADGKVTAYQQYTDTAQFQEAMGVA